MGIVNFGIEKHYYFNRLVYDKNIEDNTSIKNGLFLVRAGETFPSYNYRIERRGRPIRNYGALYVLEYVIAGCGYVEIDGECVIVKEGDFYVINASYPHKYYSDSKDPLHKVWINMTGPFIDGIARALKMDSPLTVVKYEAESCFRRIFDLLGAVNIENSDDMFDKIAVQLTTLLLAVNTAKNSVVSGRGGSIYDIKRYIDSEVNLAVTLDDICGHFYQNKSYLIYLFRKTFGVTPHKYLTNCRMEAAKDMLATTDIPIKEISSILGYPNTQYFSAVFSKSIGVPPGEYRERYSSKNFLSEDGEIVVGQSVVYKNLKSPFQQ